MLTLRNALHPGKKPKLNTQSDSIKAKLFSTQLTLSTFYIVEFFHASLVIKKLIGISDFEK